MEDFTFGPRKDTARKSHDWGKLHQLIALCIGAGVGFGLILRSIL